ncbi:MAG: hypothetical protein LBC83_01645 [Oscillospiraceae bacterium]|jgi:nitroreductase|nr:hypothetical protein [Oscillospiraceae bacterium]
MLYETIFTRRSVRQFDPASLDTEALAAVEAALAQTEQLPGQAARLTLVQGKDCKGLSAPHAILAHSAAEDMALCNVGYTLQGLDLQLQGMGLGSLWMGMAKPLEPAPDYRILLAFGKTAAPSRKNESEFKRREVLEISNEDNPVARAARLAPSAINLQPWQLAFEAGKVTLRFAPRGIVKVFSPRMQKIDLGICLRHITLALVRDGKQIQAIAPAGQGKQFCVEVTY